MIATNPGQQACDFIDCLTHPTTGDLFNLRPWQQKIVRKLVGTIGDDGQRQYKHCGIWLPRANGKTELAAALLLERFLRDPRKRRQFYCAASTREQARFLFNKVEAMIRDNPKLAKHVTIRTSNHTIINNNTGSTFKAVPSEAGAMHGSEPTFVIYDEIHVAKDRELYTSFVTGMGKVDSPMMVTITTAGNYDRTTLEFEQYHYACQVRDGVIKDPSYLPVIFEAGADDRWDLVKTWRKCNPALGDFRSLDEMKRLCKLAKQIPRLENDFRRLYLNQHTAATSRWLRQEDWVKCQAERVDKSGRWYGGADLSAKQDLTSFAITTKNDEEDGYKVLAWNWIPRDTALAHEKSDRVPYLTWEKQGFIECTPGDRVDQRFVLQRMVDICNEYGVRQIGFDSHNAEWFFQELPRHGIETIDCPQNYRTFNEPCREFESCLSSGKIETRQDECMGWQIANVDTKPTSDGRLIRPTKSTPSARIDGVVAMLMAIALTLAPDEAPEPAIY